MVVVVLLLITLAFAKQNFRVFPNSAAAAEACFNANLCDPVDGCCSGHGYCNSTTLPNPTCVCEAPVGCHSSFTTAYSGTKCETGIIGDALGSPDGCCLSDTYVVKREINGACNDGTGSDPNAGLKGNLLKRVTGSGLYGDSIGTPYNFPSPYASVESIADYLTDAGRSVEYTNFTMLGLALLQAGQLDIVRYALSDSEFHNISGKLIPKLKHQERTGEAWGTSATVQKQFENEATGEVDLDFLYTLADRIAETTYGTTGPYLDYAPMLSYFSDIASEELLVVLEFFGHNHNFLVKVFESHGWDKADGDVTPFDHTANCLMPTNFCSLFPTNQEIYDKLFEFARNANIRLLQIALENAAFSLLTPHDQPAFDYFFHADVARNWSCEARVDEYRTGSVALGSDLSAGSEFTDLITRNQPFTHLVSSGIHLLYSMAEPVNLSSIVTPDPTCDVAVPTLSQKMLTLAQTKTRKFGSRVDPAFYDGLVLQLLRERELGVESYNSHMAETGDNVARATDTDLYLGVHLDVNSTDPDYNVTRLFQATAGAIPRVLLALYTPINDALMIDQWGSWKQQSNGYTRNFRGEYEADEAFMYWGCDGLGMFCPDKPVRWGAYQMLTAFRWDYTILDEIFKFRSILHTHVCTFPGLTGSLITAGNVHYGIMHPLMFDFQTDLSMATYHCYNNPAFDEVYKCGSNALSACVPWRVSQFDSEVDSKCCDAGHRGECGCETNSVASQLCDGPKYCESYDQFILTSSYCTVIAYSNFNYNEPAETDFYSSAPCW